ncbi:MAG: GNAT family N-acetyltransferase [Colwellia sp.]
MELTKSATPQYDDFEVLRKGLASFNGTFTGPVFREQISSFVKDDSGKVVGGILGEINWNWMHIQGLWIDESFRNGGWGLKLLSEMEEYALSKNTPNIRLETTTFQALDFYVKAGYSIFGELDNMPVGHTSYFLQKNLGL